MLSKKKKKKHMHKIKKKTLKQSFRRNQTARHFSKLKVSNFNFWVPKIKQTLMPNEYRSRGRWPLSKLKVSNFLLMGPKHQTNTNDKHVWIKWPLTIIFFRYKRVSFNFGETKYKFFDLNFHLFYLHINNI